MASIFVTQFVFLLLLGHTIYGIGAEKDHHADEDTVSNERQYVVRGSSPLKIKCKFSKPDDCNNYPTIPTTTNSYENTNSYYKTYSDCSANYGVYRQKQCKTYYEQSCTQADEYNLQNSINELPSYITQFYPNQNKPDLLLSIINSTISTIGHGVFVNGSNVTRLEFENTAIGMLETKAFVGLTNLKTLNLSRTSLEQIPYGSLDGLISLQVFDVSHNKLSGILDGRNFSDIITIEELYLDNNLITSINPLTFRTLSKLKKLSLSHNLIAALESLPFRFSFNLRYLNLNNNIISNIGNSTFTGPKVLSILDLSGNKLSVWRDDPDCTIEQLYIDNNQLRRGFFNSVKSFSASYNALEDIEFAANSDAIINAICSTINLSHNTLKTIGSFKNVGRINSLLMQHNKISHIQPGSFIEFSKLAILRLDNNRLTWLDYGIFAGIESSLISLNLSYNSLRHLNVNAFYGFENLESLFIAGNQLTNLPPSELKLVYTDILRYISLENNPWDCDALLDTVKELDHGRRNTRGQIVKWTIVFNDDKEFHRPNVKGIACTDHSSEYTVDNTKEKRTAMFMLSDLVERKNEVILPVTTEKREMYTKDPDISLPRSNSAGLLGTPESVKRISFFDNFKAYNKHTLDTTTLFTLEQPDSNFEDDEFDDYTTNNIRGIYVNTDRGMYEKNNNESRIITLISTVKYRLSEVKSGIILIIILLTLVILFHCYKFYNKNVKRSRGKYARCTFVAGDQTVFSA